MIRFSDNLNSQLKKCIAEAGNNGLLALSLMSDVLDSHGHYDLANKLDKYAQMCSIAGLGDSVVVPTSPGQLSPAYLDEMIKRVDQGDWIGSEERQRMEFEQMPWAHPEERAEQVEQGDWIDPEEKERMELDKMPMMRSNEFKLDPEYVKELRKKLKEEKQKEKAPKVEPQPEEESEDMPELGQRDFKWEPEYYKKVRKPELARERRMKQKNKMSQELFSSLIVMADRFDSEGKFAMAAKIDNTLKSLARGRPRSPLKGLDEDTKKDLVKFLHNIGKRMSSSTSDLEELFRRMRYFDVADSAKPLGLDKVFKDLVRVQECVDTGKESLHSMLGGNKSELKSLLEELEGDYAEDEPEHNPLDFFNSRQETEEYDVSGEETPDVSYSDQEETERDSDQHLVELNEFMNAFPGEEAEELEKSLVSIDEDEDEEDTLNEFWDEESFEG